MLEKRENGNCWIQEEGIDDGYPKVKIGGQESRKTNMCTLVRELAELKGLGAFFDLVFYNRLLHCNVMMLGMSH